MLEYLLRRLLWSVITVWGVVTLVFVMLRVLPGDPADTMITDWGMSAEDLDEIREQMGLNDPIYVQYGRFIWDAAHGDFGRSIWSNRLVMHQIADQFPATLKLALASMLLTLCIGFPLGIIAAVGHNTWVDSASMLVALGGVSMPTFWLGLVLIMIFAVRLHWFPMAGTGGIEFLILPAFTLGFRFAGRIARLTRSSMLEVLRADYITTARAKGLAEHIVVTVHGLRNALIPVVTLLALQLAALLGGAVITETVFSRRGIGAMAVAAVKEKDYPLMQGLAVVVALAYVLANLWVDLAYAWLDPRIRHGED
jgi:peptide/nickel transport system permease protein